MMYRKVPVEIEALVWNGSNLDEMKRFCKNCSLVDGSLVIFTLEGDMTASIGDYIINGVKGEFYPCKPEIFNLTYERV